MATINTANVGLNAFPLVPAPLAGSAPTLYTIVNLDTENTVNIGSQPSSLPFPLGPLASTTLEAPVWAAAATAPLVVGILPEGSSYSPGSLTITGPVTATITGTVDANITNVADINITNADVNVIGAGGFINPGAYDLLLSDTSSHGIGGGGGMYSSPVTDVRNYQSYSLQLQIYNSTQGTNGSSLCLPVQVSYWADAAGSNLIDAETWWMWVADSAADATDIPLRLSGPLKGGYLSFSILNPGTTTANADNIQLYGSGRSLSESEGRQASPAGKIFSSTLGLLPTTAPEGVLQGFDNILGWEANNAIAGGTNLWFPMPLMSGTVWLRFLADNALTHNFTVSSAAGLQNPGIVAGASTTGIVWDVPAAAAEYEQLIVCGRAPMYFVVSPNAGGTTFSFSAQGVPAA